MRRLMSQEKIKLYQYEVCPFCCKVKAVLDYKKIPYETIEVDPLSKAEIKFVENYRKVPVLVDGDEVVVESDDIIRYLDKKFPNKPVFSADKKITAAQEKWMKSAEEDLVQILPANIYRSLPESLSSFAYITKVGKFPRWKRYAIAASGAAIMTMVAKKGAKKRGITDPRASLKKTLLQWNESLGDKPFMGGASPDVSDLIYAGILDSVRQLKVWKFIESETPITPWYNRVQTAIGRHA